jgi:hypothetical protein
MSHQDKVGSSPRLNAQYLRQALVWLLGRVSWKETLFREDCSWLPMQLAAAALLWAWSDESTLGERFCTARKIAQHLYQPQQEFAGSVQAFMKLLVRWTDVLVRAVQNAWRLRMQESLAAQWTVHGWAVFGVDGSRIELPRTKSHEGFYSIARHRSGKKVKRSRRLRPLTKGHTKKANTPQMWLTLLFHVGTGLPWCWRSGPTGSNERAHARDMLDELPPHALVAGDAGFVGYDYLQAVLASGRQVLVRVGSNVRLLRQLGWTREVANTVYLWPQRAQKHLPPVVLRLIVAHGGKHPVYLVTSVPRSQLSQTQVIDIYRRRWGIELCFRHFKQTFQRRKLRSASADHARVELEWSLLGLWGMCLYAQVEQAKRAPSVTNLSVACVLRSFRRMLRDYQHPAEQRGSLRALLRHAVRDNYVRKDKTSRDYPRKKPADPPAGPPQILVASHAQRSRAKIVRRQLKGLTA